MEAIDFAQMQAHVGFDESHSRRLEILGPIISPHIPRIVDIFYERLLADPQARAIFTDPQQIQRQHGVLREWMEQLFGGKYDRDYFRHRGEIGKAHVHADVPQRFVLTGMNIIRTELCKAICSLHVSDHQGDIEALNKLLDLELAVMLETFRENYVAKIRASDKRVMQQQLQEVQHMASIGQLAASLAHEIKNPIAGISGAIQIISRDLQPDDPHFEIMREILRQIDRLDSTVKDLLIYARPKPPERRVCDVGEMIHNCLALLSEDPAMKTMQVEERGLDLGISTALDTTQFSQVVSNVVLNAAQACEGRGRVRITLTRDSAHVITTFSDDGPGMSPQVLKRALEPFYTTKARGTGLGLSICKRIIDAHHGTLQIDTSPHQGTTITVRLPGENHSRSPEDDRE